MPSSAMQNRTRRAVIETLETRFLLAFDPSPQEQEMLELVNRLRTNPTAELDLLLAQNDQNVTNAVNDYNVNMQTLRSQWALLKPVAPVAWNVELYHAARAHTQAMITADEQSHQLSGEASLRDRIDGQGYNPESYLGENVYGFAKSAFHAHAAFAIDWGSTPTGIQEPPGHRETMLDTLADVPVHFREVGISVLSAPAGTRQTGPLLVTEDFGGPLKPGNAYLMGTISNDLNHNGIYNAGEGLGGIKVHIAGTGGTFDTTTMSAGGYQLRVPPGTYTITASTGLAAPVVKTNVVVAADNVKVDFNAAPDTGAPVAIVKAPAAKRGAKTYSFIVTYKDPSGVDSSTIGKGDVLVSFGKKFRQTATFVSKKAIGSTAIRAVYRISPPGGTWDAADNGVYSIKLCPKQVADNSGNVAKTGTLGTFTVKLSRTRSRSVAAESAFAAPTQIAAASAAATVNAAFSTKNIFDIPQTPVFA